MEIWGAPEEIIEVSFELANLKGAGARDGFI